MSRPLTITGTTYNYPSANENPGWGEDASDWAQAVTDAINNIVSSNDLATTTSLIADNVTSFTNITGANLLTPGVKSFTVYYVVNRSDGASNFNEYGFLNGVYDGSAWQMTREFDGNSSVSFDITNAGQIRYKSSAIGGIYTGTIKFRTTSGVL